MQIRAVYAFLALVFLFALSTSTQASSVCYLDSYGAPYAVNIPEAKTPADAVAALAYPPLGYTSAIPTGAKLLSFTVGPDGTQVEFSTELISGGIDDVRLEALYTQIRNTIVLSGLSPRVDIVVDGKPISQYTPDRPADFPHPARVLSMATASTTGLAGKVISISPGHGLVWNGSSWNTERPVYCAPLNCEDDHTDEIARYLNIYLTQDGATTKVYRCLDKNYGDYASGKPWWRMSAGYWLQHQGYPCSVYGWYSAQYHDTQHCTLATDGTSDSGDSLDSRPVASNYDNADCYVSVHTNGLSGHCTGSGCPTGTATYYDTSSTHATWTAVSKTLAEDIQTSVVNAIRTQYTDSTWSDNGAIGVDGNYAETRIPTRAAALIELAFHDTCDRDAVYLRDNFFRCTSMWAVYKGICDYFGTTPTWDYYSYEVVASDFPSTMEVGATYNAHLVLRNRGVLWNETHQFRLGAVGDSDPLASATRYTVTDDIEPGQTVTFTIPLTAPTTPGTYTTDWQMVREGVTWFGPTVQKSIEVTPPPDPIAPTISATNTTPAKTAAGYQVKLTVVATDNVGVTGVTADGADLTKGPGNSWYEYVNADPEIGRHAFSIIVKDTAGNQTTNTTTSYTTAKVYGLPTAALTSGGPAQIAAANYLYRVWGTVSPVDTNSFDVNDGSGVNVRVYCSQHGLSQGQFITAFGIMDYTTNPPQLKSQTTQLQILHSP